MNQNDLDTFTSRVINKLKKETEEIRNFILEGQLPIEDYRTHTGFLAGIEDAIQTLIDENQKFMKETLDD